jgi:lipopolysaccharide/colanic/teichoic acid biosynthesis glycosyltransferase
MEGARSVGLEVGPVSETGRRDPAKGGQPQGSTLQRAFDVMLATGGLVIAAPLLVGSALAVRISLGRPILFRQIRAGRRGVPFEILKFRTMTEERDPSGALLPDAMRMTRAGRLLRRARLDELPQILNVLRGEMSVVGPRALPCGSMGSFGAARDRRQSVRPGLTGWAQVNGNTLLTESEKLSLDVWYVDHRSLLLDLLILLRTAMVIALGERVNKRHLGKARAHALRRYGIG